MNPIQIFYSNPYFEGLHEIQPFKEYLERGTKNKVLWNKRKSFRYWLWKRKKHGIIGKVCRLCCRC